MKRIFNTTEEVIDANELSQKLKQSALEIKKLYMELRDSQERFENATRMMPAVYCELDEKHCFMYVNETGLRIFGYTENEVLGKSCLDLLPKEYHALHIHRLENLKKGKCNSSMRCKMVKKNGEILDCIIQSSPIIKDGNIIGSRCVINDITLLIKKDEELSRLKEENNSIFAVLDYVNQNKTLADSLFSEASKVIDPILLNDFRGSLITGGFLGAA